MAEEIRNNLSSRSTDPVRHPHKSRLDLIIEQNALLDSNKKNLLDNITNKENIFSNPLEEEASHKKYNSCERRKKNPILQQKLKEILDYKAKFKSLEKEEESDNESKNNENDEKKKIDKKVNRNLKLLNIIKEKMNKDNTIKNNNNSNNNYEKDDNKNILIEDKNLNENNNNNSGKNIEDKKIINNDENSKKKDEEKKKKLLKLFDKKRYNKREDNIKNDNKKENKKKEENNNKINQENDNKKNKAPTKNTISISYPSFMKKDLDNSSKNTQEEIKLNKMNINSSEKEKEENKNDLNEQNNGMNNKKYSDIPKEQKNKLTINIKPKNISFTSEEVNKNSIQESNKKENNKLEDKITFSSSKKESKTNRTSNKNNNSSSKKGAMQILELLKAQRKELNKNKTIETDKNIKPKKNETFIEIENNNKKRNEKNSSHSLHQRKSEDSKHIKSEKYDASSLPKKKFREEDENNLTIDDDIYNRTQHIFRKNKKIINNNNNNRIKTNYFNNINNNINNYFNIGEASNYPERKAMKYIKDAYILRNKYNKSIRGFNSIQHDEIDDLNDDLFRTGNISHINYYTQKNSLLYNNKNLNKKKFDKSFDICNERNSPLEKRDINRKKISNIYEPKKIFNNLNNNSPRNMLSYRPYEINTNKVRRIENPNNKMKYKRNVVPRAYIKKSPGKINNIIGENRDKKSISQIYRDLNIKNKKTNINQSREMSAIYGINTNLDTLTSSKTNIKAKKNKKDNTMLFNLEDLMILEERLNDITSALESNKNVQSQCFNFWNYYFNCSLYKILEKIFPNEEDSNIVRISINYELMSIMVCYEFSLRYDFDDEDLNLSLIELIYFNHNNLIAICEYILNKISPENKENIWVLKLREIITNSNFSKTKEIKTTYSLTPIKKVANNTNKIIQKIKSILSNYKSESSSLLKNYFPNIPSKKYSEINTFFRSKILRIANAEGSLVPPSYFRNNRNFKPIPPPYLMYPSPKPYTLILDLDETLVSFQIKTEKEGTLRARPFLFAFLEEMGHYYELIIWTSATESYANTLIDAIEYDKQYFDFILYREHATIINDEFVKDLNRVGRGLDRIIIVDDMPQNFRLQKQNGITIKPFLGDDYNDTALYDLLPILKHIAEDGNDVRIELAKYRDEIAKKITSNIYKRDF